MQQYQEVNLIELVFYPLHPQIQQPRVQIVKLYVKKIYIEAKDVPTEPDPRNDPNVMYLYSNMPGFDKINWHTWRKDLNNRDKAHASGLARSWVERNKIT